MSNKQFADRIEFALEVVLESVATLCEQQRRIEDRLAFIAPTPMEVDREIQAFIDSATAT